MILFSVPIKLFAAVGCDLNDPDRDVKRLFTNSTGFKTNYISIDKKGGSQLLSAIADRLGDKFKGLYETADVPYTIYDIYKNKEKIGYIHGVNQKGTYGGLQVFLSLDLEGNIKSFYIQKLTSRYAKQLRSSQFGRQFEGLSLKDFNGYDVVTGKSTPGSRVGKIANSSHEAGDDFKSILRGVKKNLILMDEFVYANKVLKK